MAENECKRPDTYAKAGVDLDREDRAIKGIRGWVSKTFGIRDGMVGEVMCDIGSFANLIDLGDRALAFCIDGVGSKVLVAQALEKYDTIGIDCVAMNVNDLICTGAEPISMVDYLALENTDDDLCAQISKGLDEGARQANISIVGGETASLPNVITGLDGRGFDIAAAAIGLVDKGKIITGERVRTDDIVLGFKSSGIHSNGLSLARKVLPKSMWMSILKPTRIYVREVLDMTRGYDIRGLANITGGGFLNMYRMGGDGYVFDNLFGPQMVFKRIRQMGDIGWEEMYRTFNMGVGFAAVASPDEAERIVDDNGKKWGIQRIGYVSEEPNMKIITGDDEIILERKLY